jgi:hypothetical protein
VRLTAAQIGALKAAGCNTLTLYVNGHAVPGDPALAPLPADRTGVRSRRSEGPGARQL